MKRPPLSSPEAPDVEHPLQAFAAALWLPTDRIELRRITPPRAGKPNAKPKIEQTWINASDVASNAMLAMLAAENARGANIYAIINPLSRDGGTDEDVGCARSFFVDFDGGATPEDARRRAAEAGLPEFSMLVSSGHGCHGYWLLDEPLTDLGEWRRIQKALIATLGSDKAIHNPSRVMRLPGFANTKYEPHVPCTLVEAQPHNRYPLARFALPSSKLSVPPQHASVSTGARVAGHDLRAGRPTVPNPGGVDGLSQATREFLTHGAPEGSRNHSLFAAACDYYGCHLSKDKAMEDLGHAARKCGLSDNEIQQSIDSAYSKPRDPSRKEITDPQRTPLLRKSSTSGGPPSDTASPLLSLTRAPGSDKNHLSVTVYKDDEVVFAEDIKIMGSQSRARFVKAVCGRLPDADPHALEELLTSYAATHLQFISETKDSTDETPTREELLERYDEEVEASLRGMPARVIAEAERMLADPNLIDIILEDIQAVGVVGDVELALMTYLIATSRQLEAPLAAIVQGVTCSGKSYVPERVCKLLPSESVFVATDITPNALFYIPPGGLMHRFIRAGERSRNDQDERAEATRALREILSAGELNKLVPVKSPGGGPMVTMRLYQPGPIAYIESTTKTQIFDEDANRCLMLGTDESHHQTKAIVRAQAARAASGKSAADVAIIAKHHALQRLLKRCSVRIPYAPVLAELMPTQRQDARRAMPQILTAIAAVALLHQRQRTKDYSLHGFEIEATEHDYVIARRLLIKPMARGLGGGLPEAAIRFWSRLNERFGADEFSSNEALAGDALLHSKSKVNDYLRTLMEAGSVECVEDARGNKPARWKLVGEEPQCSADWFPTVEQLRGGSDK